MKINTITFQKHKETKIGNITTIETNTTIFVEPVKIKTQYHVLEKENNNESNTNEH